MKHILLPLIALFSGAAGFALRRWQLAVAYNAETELFLSGAVPTMALLLLLAVTLVVIFVLIQGGEAHHDFLPAFRAPSTMHMTALTMAAFLFLGSGVLGMLEGMQQLNLWRSAPGAYVLTYPAALLLCSVLCFPAGLACLTLGKGIYRETLSHSASFMACFPPLAGLVWLFATHLNHGTDPVLMRYGFSLAAAVFLTLAHYYVAGFFFDLCHTRRALFFSLSGVSLGLTALADLSGYYVMALTAAFVLSALTWSCALLRNVYGPPWPERMPIGANEEEDEEPESHSTDTDEGVL